MNTAPAPVPADIDALAQLRAEGYRYAEEMPTDRIYWTEVMYSDCTAWVEVSHTRCTFDIVELEAVRDPTWHPEFEVGGFAAHCANQHQQRWLYRIPQNGGRQLRIRRNAKDADKAGYKGRIFRAYDKPFKFHDYNF